MTSAYLYRLTCRLIALLFFTLCFDPVFAQSGGINWGAVGISWVLSTATTCLLIAVAFGIRGCLRHKKDVKTSNDDEGDVEQVGQGERQRLGPAVLDQHHLVTTSADKMNSGLLSVSQQSAYLRAQNDTGKNRRKSQPRRVKTEHEPRDWVEQWCEEQAKRESVVAALQTVSDSPVPSANVREDHLLRYPAGLDLPSTDIRQSTRNDRNKDPVQKRTGASALIYAEPKELQPRKETVLQRPTGQNLVADTGTRALEDKQTVRNSNHFQVSTPKMATAVTEVKKTVTKELLNVEVMPSKTTSDVPLLKSQQSVRKTEVIEELKDSPVRVRKQQRDAQKRSDLPQPGAKTKVLEFKRPPNEIDSFVANETAFQNRKDQFHKEIVVVDKGDAKSAPSQKQEAVTSSEEEEEEESEEESDREPVVPAPLRASNPPAMSEAKETLPSSQTRGVKRSLSPSAYRNESPETTTAVRPTKSSTMSMVESTPPTPLRPTSVRRAPRQSKPSVLNIVPMPADGVSPPPGLLPLTASSHHQVTKGQRQAAAASAVSQVAEDKRGRKAAKKDEEKAVERRQKSSKRDKSKERPPSFDFKNKRASTGSDILFFAPELQGTSTPAMRPKSAFMPASVPLLSHDTVDDEDDDDERQKGASSSKGVVTSTFLTQRPQFTNVSQSKQFHGILSDSGLHELAHSVCQEWRHLANSLHVPAEHQAKLVTNYSSDAEKCTYALLRGWRDRFSGSKGELRSVLCNALVAVNHPEMAEKLIQEEMVGSSEKLDNLKLVSVV